MHPPRPAAAGKGTDMNFWRILSTAVICLSALSILFLATRVSKFAFVRRLAKDSRLKRFFIGLFLTAAAAAILWFTIDAVNMMIVILHVVVIWLLAGLCGIIIRTVRRRQNRRQALDEAMAADRMSLQNRGAVSAAKRNDIQSQNERSAAKRADIQSQNGMGKSRTDGNPPAYRPYFVGIFALLFSVIWLCYGWYSAHHVVATYYTVKTEKDIGDKPFRVIMFADSHIGSTFGGSRFSEYAREMEALDPDIVVVVGDYADDDSPKEDVEICCQALGSIRTSAGVFYVYGNHDRGYFSTQGRGFSGAELEKMLEENGVHVLQDERVMIGGNICLIGREDARYLSRSSMETLTADLPDNVFSIVLDHEPHDYEAQEASGVDLVLSGHTHGGWLFPFNNLAYLTGSDDKVYGLEQRGNTHFIVTSGISDWRLKFKTSCKAEYVVIDIQ